MVKIKCMNCPDGKIIENNIISENNGKIYCSGGLHMGIIIDDLDSSCWFGYVRTTQEVIDEEMQRI